MPFELLPESKLISDCRIVKDAAEIAELQKAQNVADAAFAEVLKHVKVGMTEIELRNEFDYLIRKFGGMTIRSTPSSVPVPTVRFAMRIPVRARFRTVISLLWTLAHA